MAPVETPPATPAGPKSPKIVSTDVAVLGADVAGLAAAVATARANPGARIVLYDSASEPPPACDGGVLLSRNGLMALKALDANLYARITTELASPVMEALWFDLEGELVRRTSLGQMSLGAAGGSSGSGNRRRSALRRAQTQAVAASASGAADPNASAAPLIISLHDLREALAEALPEGVEIFGRHHVTSIEPCANCGSTGSVGRSSAGGAVLRFAASASGTPLRSVQTKVVVGADGPHSAVKRLQFDGGNDEATPSPAGGRVVWRGRLTLRQRDPDFARLRNFTAATRTWVDLRATHGSERTASLSPAGPNTYVWSASCPASLLASRGLSEEGGASAYWRCLAMFEDFPQDFFAALRATAASAVVEYGNTSRTPPPSAAAGLAAPWRWFSGSAALVGDAVYSLPVDDVSSTAINLALEDAAVLGACTASYGLTARALQEYARQRGSRVSSLLALPPSAPERARLRDAPFLPQSSAPPAQPAPAPSSASSATVGELPSLAGAVAAAVDAAAAATVAVTSPTQPLEDLLAAAAASAAASAPAGPMTPVGSPPEGRPSGGASRTLPAPRVVPAAVPPLPSPTAPSSPLFSRPSGARRMGPVPAAIAAVIGVLATGAANGRGASASAATATVPAAADPAPAASTPSPATSIASSSSVACAPKPPCYAPEATPRSMWESLLLPSTDGSAPAEAAAAELPPPQLGVRQEYCAVQTPAVVWHALLLPPAKAHDMLVSLPYNAAESPALVWAALLGAPVAVAACAASAVSATSAATSTIPLAPADIPCTLLPRPVLKPKSAAASAAAAGATSTPEPALGAAPEAPASSVAKAAEAATAQQRRGPPSATVGAGSALDSQLQRRRPRSQAGPVSGRWAGSDRRGSGGGKAKRSATTTAAAAAAAAGSATAAAPSAAAVRAKAKAKAKAAAAKAAATVTAGLGAAAALGGVIGAAGSGHMMPMDVAAALHAHSTVAQFWEELNSLTLSSASSLSSIDLS